MTSLFKLFFASALVFGFLFLESCSSITKVYSEEEPGINLAKYHTFNWLDNTAQQGNNGPEWLTAGTQQKIRTAVEDQMSRYDFKLCTENPEIVLHYHVVVKNDVLYVRDWTCGRPGEGVTDRCNRFEPVHYQEGTLIIDMIDAKNGVQVWRGAAVSVLNNMRPSEVEARIQEATTAIFKKFPERPVPKA